MFNRGNVAGEIQMTKDERASIRILEQNDNETKTEETIVFSTIVKKQIVQETVHKKKNDNELITKMNPENDVSFLRIFLLCLRYNLIILV